MSARLPHQPHLSPVGSESLGMPMAMRARRIAVARSASARTASRGERPRAVNSILIVAKFGGSVRVAAALVLISDVTGGGELPCGAETPRALPARSTQSTQRLYMVHLLRSRPTQDTCVS